MKVRVTRDDVLVVVEPAKTSYSLTLAAIQRWQVSKVFKVFKVSKDGKCSEFPNATGN